MDSSGPRGDYGDYVGGPQGNFSEVRDPNNPDASRRNLPAPRTGPARPAQPSPIDIVNGAVGPNPAARVTSARFDPEFGYIVDSEDDGILMANGLNPNQREALREHGKLLSEKDAEKVIYEDLRRKGQERFEEEIQGLGPAELDAFMRFGDLAL